MNLVPIGIIGAIIVIAISSINWRISVKTVLIIVIIEGALRKWAFPQASQLIYFLKDFILLGAYLSYFASPQTPKKIYVQHETIKGLIIFTAFWCFLEIFNPGLGSPIIGIFGVANYLIYIPLMWMIPSLFCSEQELDEFLRHYLLLLIPVGILAVIQYYSPPDSILNIYAHDTEYNVSTAGGAVRVTGTFSYMNGYYTYLSVCFTLLLPLILKPQTIVWRCFSFVELLLIVVTSLMTGSRGVILFLVLAIVGYLFLEGWRDLNSLIKSLEKLLIPAFFSLALLFSKFSATIISFETRASNADNIWLRIVGSFTEPFLFFQHALFSGYGAGATSYAGDIIRQIFSLPSGEHIPVYFEPEPGKVMLELGMIGFCTWYMLKIALIIALWTTYKQLRRSFFKNLALSIFLFQVINIANYFVFNRTAGVYFWFLSGFILLLPQLEQVELRRQNNHLRQISDRSFNLRSR